MGQVNQGLPSAKVGEQMDYREGWGGRGKPNCFRIVLIASQDRISSSWK